MIMCHRPQIMYKLVTTYFFIRGSSPREDQMDGIGRTGPRSSQVEPRSPS